ncbi:MAG: hypothetical protein JWQ39_1201 [Glaciihabitans sp.]|nr:hypothetical protein [Glaciihabitans sp.]
MTVPTVSVLTFVTELIKLHQEPRAVPAPRLVAASISERERWIPLIRDVLEVEEGVLVDAASLGLGVEAGALTTDAPGIIGWVNGMASQFNAQYPDANLQLSLVGTRAEITGTSLYESANAAQRGFREVLTAVCSDSLRSSELAMLLFAQDAMEDDLLAILWPGLMQLPNLLGSGNSSTLAVVAGDGQINFGIHCIGDPSLRFRISDYGIAFRHSRAQSRAPIEALGRQADTDQRMITLFLGAGASTSTGLPTGNELRNQALATITSTVVDEGTFSTVATEWFAQLESTGALSTGELEAGIKAFVRDLTLERVLQQEQFDEKQTNSATLRRFAITHANAIAALKVELAGRTDALETITASQKRLVLVTVNFDQVIETRCGSNVRPFITEADMLLFPDYLKDYLSNGGQVPLLKLHGDIGMPETIVANLQQTAAGLSVARDRALNSVIDTMHEMPVHPWWYLGYSMRDRDLEQAWTAPRMSNFNEHWIAPFLDPTVEEFINERRLKNWQDAGRPEMPFQRLISLTAEEFYDAFIELVVSRW